jgi:tetratricopeptide (TPR) repeat protein
MGNLYINLLQGEKAIDQLNLALKFLLNGAKGPSLAYLYHHLGIFYLFDEQFEKSREWSRKAVELARELRLLEVEIISSEVSGFAFPISEMEPAFELFQQAERSVIDLKGSVADLSISRAYGFLGGGYFLIRGDSRNAARWYIESVNVAKLIGERRYVTWFRAYLATLGYIPLGEWSKARDALTETSPSGLTKSYPLVKARTLLALGMLALCEGQLDKAEEYLTEIYSTTPRFGGWLEKYDACGLLGQLCIEKEDYVRAERYLKEGYDHLKGKGLFVYNARRFVRIVYLLVQLCIRQGREKEAAGFLAELREFGKTTKADWAYAYYFDAAGAFASYREEWDQAQDSLEESAKYWERLQWPYELAWTHQALSLVHHENGEVETANRLLDSALATFTSLGATLDAKRAESLRALNGETLGALSVTKLARAGGERTKVIFSYLVEAFMGDYFVKRLSPESSGWRSSVEIARGTGVPVAAFYEGERDSRGGLGELQRLGLAEARTFTGQRGRGGKITRARIAFDKDEVKQYITKKWKKRGERTAAVER